MSTPKRRASQKWRVRPHGNPKLCCLNTSKLKHPWLHKGSFVPLNQLRLHYNCVNVTAAGWPFQQSRLPLLLVVLEGLCFPRLNLLQSYCQCLAGIRHRQRRFQRYEKKRKELQVYWIHCILERDSFWCILITAFQCNVCILTSHRTVATCNLTGAVLMECPEERSLSFVILLHPRVCQGHSVCKCNFVLLWILSSYCTAMHNHG